MNDRLYMDNYLLILKSTMEVYVHGTLESSNNDSQAILKSGLDETIKSQANCYAKMTEYGWYKIDNIKKSLIKETINKINKKQ